MKSIGFIISHKDGELRRMMLPEDVKKVEHPECLYFEYDYGKTLNIEDSEYSECGVHIVSREEVLKCDIIVDRKLGEADYLDLVKKNQILVGAAHAVQNIEFTDMALNSDFTIIATEEIFENGRYAFYQNNELAGEAAVMQAFRYCGKMPYDTKVAILGNGLTAKGAMRILHGLGANVDVYGRKLENLFRINMYNYDVIINCLRWDTNRSDRIIYKSDLKKMKKGTLIIDISCDPNLEIETSRPTTIADPIYVVDGVIHYAVDNTPSMFPISATKAMSTEFVKYVNELVSKEIDDFSDSLKSAVVIKDGHIIDERISSFRNARGVFCK